MTSKPPWTESDWLDKVSSWIFTELSQLGIATTGPIEQPHIRPWSIVLRIPTLEGAVYFKDCAGDLIFEPALTQKMSSWYPDHMPKILAVNLENGWMLMEDGGTTLREVIRADRDISHWEKLLPLHAELQIKITDHLPELLALGAPDRQLATLPEKYNNLLNNKNYLLLDQPDGITSAEYDRLINMTTRVEDISEKLAASPIPESVHHGDFHDANIFLNDDHFVFFDWGDCSVSHPFFSLRTVCVSLEYSLDLEEYPPEFDGLRDVYLHSWMQYDSFENLLNTFNLAGRLSPICSALGYLQTMSTYDDSLGSDYAGAIPGLLQEFLSLEDRASDQSLI